LHFDNPAPTISLPPRTDRLLLHYEERLGRSKASRIPWGARSLSALLSPALVWRSFLLDAPSVFKNQIAQVAD